MATATPKTTSPAPAPKPAPMAPQAQGKPTAPVYTDYASI